MVKVVWVMKATQEGGGGDRLGGDGNSELVQLSGGSVHSCQLPPPIKLNYSLIDQFLIGWL